MAVSVFEEIAMYRHRLLVVGLMVGGAALLTRPASTQPPQGQGLIIELDNTFIDAYENRVTISSEHSITGISSVHKAKNDGEVHVGGWVHEAGLAGVVEVMNASHSGKPAMRALQKALNDGQKATVTGAWRIWGEHAGLGQQIQARGMEPKFPLPGEFPSNPDHVFEIHPVTSVKAGETVTSAADAIGPTEGFTPHEAHEAFLLGYEKLTCKIIPKEGRTRIGTKALGFNFTEFVIRLGENPVALQDGHGVICSVFDADGVDLRVRHRRMVFIKGTEADDV